MSRRKPSTRNSTGNNYTTTTTDNGNGTQTERSFATREDRQLYVRTRGSENPPSIGRETRTVERSTLGDDE